MKLFQIIPLALALLVPSAALAAEKSAPKDHAAESASSSKSSKSKSSKSKAKKSPKAKAKAKGSKSKAKSASTAKKTPAKASKHE